MGTRARREKEKENMRTAILESATQIIVKDGYEKLSMRKIADAIEYTPTTLYNYYKDKAQIVDDIARAVYEKIIFNIEKALDENKDVSIDKQLRISFRVFIETMISNSEMGKAVIRSGTKSLLGPSDSTDTSEKDGAAVLQVFLLKGQEQSIFRKLDDDISWMLISALIGFSIFAIENQLYLNKNWPTQVSIFIEMLINGLLAGGDNNSRKCNR